MPQYSDSKDSFLRLADIIGQAEITPAQAEANRKAGRRGRKARPAIRGVIPISASAWWAGVKDGRFPKPIKLSANVTVWRASEIYALMDDREAA